MVNPENIHCLALNYVGVGSNIEKPLYFVKSKNSLCFDGTIVEYPKDCLKMWTEVELGIVIKKSCYKVSEFEAEKYIEGFIVCADITCENIHGRDHHLAYSKSRKNYCPVSSNVILMSPNELTNFVNGVLTQEGNTKDMFFNPYKSTSYLSSITELCKGDIILTGTPSGVENNTINNGDKVIHRIEKIGEVGFQLGR
jgi:5-oxopent-3-ene-1,2,5-tricarboxylate decarboxylase / 2-hydroxyhepta-2,4-diene-1,7-dioate isomerase